MGDLIVYLAIGAAAYFLAQKMSESASNSQNLPLTNDSVPSSAVAPIISTIQSPVSIASNGSNTGAGATQSGSGLTDLWGNPISGYDNEANPIYKIYPSVEFWSEVTMKGTRFIVLLLLLLGCSCLESTAMVKMFGLLHLCCQLRLPFRLRSLRSFRQFSQFDGNCA